IKNIMIKNSDIIFYVVGHMCQDDYDDLRTSRLQRMALNKNLPIIFVIHQPTYLTDFNQLSRTVEKNMNQNDVRTCNQFGFTTGTGRIITHHVFLIHTDPNDMYTWLSRNEPAIQYIKSLMCN